MGQKRRRARDIDPDVLAEIKRLALRDTDLGPAAIEKFLKRNFSEEIVPSGKTIGRVVSETRYRDGSGVWQLSDEEVDPDDAALILPVIVGGSVTRREAAWIARLRRAVPDVPLRAVLDITRAYLSFEHHGRSTEALDFLLATAPWRTAADADDNAWTDRRPLSAEWLEAIYLGRYAVSVRDPEVQQ